MKPRGLASEALAVNGLNFTPPPASGPWEYWISNVTPGPTTNLGGGSTVTYTLNARRVGFGGASVTGAVALLQLTGDATFTSAPITASGPNGVTQISSDGKSLQWEAMQLDTSGFLGLTNNTRSITVTVTVSPGATGGKLSAAMTSDPQGVKRSGSAYLGATTHNIVGPTVGDCSFAEPGSGAHAQSICWFDLAGYSQSQATSTAGQYMQQDLPNGYRLRYTIKTTGSGPANANAVVASALPTWSGGFLGNPAPQFVNSYQGIDGRPALYQVTNGAQTQIELTNIVLLDVDGNQVQGFALVGADAESTDGGEWIQWNSDKPFTSIGVLGNACGGSLTFTSTMDVTCSATQTNSKTGTPILYSENPTWFRQTMKGNGLQGVAFGVMVSGVQLSKQIVNPVSPEDAFTITAARTTNGSGVLGTATTDETGFATTGQLHMIASGSNSQVVLSEAPVAGTDAANYVSTWSCTKNNAPYSPPGTDTSKTVTVAFGDFVNCEITNTGPTLSLTKIVDNSDGGSLEPDDWTLSATPAVGAPVTSTGNAVPLPIGQYTLSETSTAPGHSSYAPGVWQCADGSGPVPVGDDVITILPGAQVSCVITNTYIPTAEITLSKVALDTAGNPLPDASGWNLSAGLGAASSAGLTLTPEGPQTTDASGHTPLPWTLQFISADQSATVEIAEGMQGGYALVGVVCTITPLAGPAQSMSFTDVADAVVEGVQPGDQVDCVITNQQLPGSVTWSKIADDAAATLLAGSEWTLSGPGVPANTVIVDCTSGACASAPFTDADGATGQFLLEDLAWGEYTLTESKAPAGYRLDSGTEHVFTISASALTAAIGPIVNDQLAVPDLPFTGGLSSDLFLALGGGLLAVAGIGAFIFRRRSAAIFPS